MPIVPYDPFNVFRGGFPSLPSVFDDDWFEGRLTNMPRLRVDVLERSNEVIVTAEIPGLEKKEDVQITVHNNHLHLSGHIERATEQKDESIHRTERYYGQFARTIPLPSRVDESGAKASYKNGILEVRIPKSRQDNGSQIDVDFH